MTKDTTPTTATARLQQLLAVIATIVGDGSVLGAMGAIRADLADKFAHRQVQANEAAGQQFCRQVHSIMAEYSGDFIIGIIHLRHQLDEWEPPEPLWRTLGCIAAAKDQAMDMLGCIEIVILNGLVADNVTALRAYLPGVDAEEWEQRAAQVRRQQELNLARIAEDEAWELARDPSRTAAAGFHEGMNEAPGY